MVDECERVDSNHHSAGQLLYRQVSSPVAQRSRGEEGGRPDSNRHQRASQARMLTAYTTATMKQRLFKDGDDRNRTGGFSVDSRALCAIELRPQVARVGFEPTISSS